MSELTMPAKSVREAVTGTEYVRHITRDDADRRARAAFQDLVLSLAPAGATLLDFGAGTGMDARFFAERGFTVEAYDVDRKMCEYLAADCRELIASGRIRLEEGEYAEFLRRERDGDRAPVDMVISNFAPLSLVDELPELFEKFDRITGPRARVLVSVLSPYHIAEMRHPWWWWKLPRLWRDGYYFAAGPYRPVSRRRLGNFAALCGPSFRLTRVYRGLQSRDGRAPRGVDLTRPQPFAWLTAATSRFMFLLFEKRA